MKKSLWLVMPVMVLIVNPLFADIKDPPGFIFILDAGAPVRGAEGRYGADFGKSFLEFAGQARLARNFFAECSLAWYHQPRSSDDFFYHSDGFEVALAGIYKFPVHGKIRPFVKIGVSYAWILSNNAYMEQFYPDAGRQTDRWLGVNVGGGVEYTLGRKLLLRVGGTFTVVPNDGEGAVASWGKLFAGLGIRVK